MRKTITLLLMSFLCTTVLFAQERNCGVMENLEFRTQQDPGLTQRMADIEAYTRIKTQELEANREINGNIITIPVVVHVLYNNSTTNISDAQILSQIDVMNEDFRRLNSDADGTWSQAADTQIEFCMSSVDPSGNATNAITRKSVTRQDWGTNDDMKKSSQGGVDPWNTSEYLNMWVVPQMTSGGQTILGYAQFPGGSAATDGVVMGYNYFGRIGNVSAPFDLGRTTTHEVGHFLNLRHIWGDGGCGFDDFVSDTPESDASNGGCNPSHVSCGTVDMVQNYMDYSDDDCMNLFTQGQTDRMRTTLLPGGVRASLGASAKCGAPPAPTCTDGIQNGDETGVDCGGTSCAACPPAPTCTDGIQNGDETGVDCGGSCAACPSGCSDNEVTVTITLDNYPEETAWTITNDGGATVASGSYSTANPDGSTVTEDLCLPDDCYTFTITDAYGDGICCSYGNGSYAVTDSSGTLASGGAFGSSEATNFCLGAPPAPTCTDGVQNGDETGVDCGGSSCAPCSGGGDIVLHEGFFESGWDGWSDGGGDCYRYSGSRSSEGSYSIRIRDNSGTRSAMTSESFNLTSYNQVEVQFLFYANSMENGEDFWLRFNNGSGWTTVATWARGTNFNNSTYYTATVTLDDSQYNFGSNSQFRFQCDASGNGDQVYIDGVKITGLGSGARIGNDETLPLQVNGAEEGFNSEVDFIIYPNPVNGSVLNVELHDDVNATYRVLNMLGQTILTGNLENKSINVGSLESAVYFIEVNDGEETMVRKFIKK